MSNWIEQKQLLGDRRLPLENLKCCPLCGVLNAIQNLDCFVCGWHGRFDHNPDHIENCLMELLDRCPELADAITEPAPPPASLWQRIRNWCAGLFSRRIDMRV